MNMSAARLNPYSPGLDVSTSPAVPATPDPTPAPQLRLAAALQLLGQSGHSLPDFAQVGQTVWLQSVIDALCDLSSRDALTGLSNRRQFELALAREIDRVARAGEPALVLKAVAASLMSCVRPMDTVARFGGEEFAIILPNCPPAFGQMVAERIRSKVEGTPVTVARRQSLSVTISLGGAFAPQWVRSSATLWIERADQQLYRAKREGRNRACLEQPPVSLVSAEEKGMLFGTSQFQDIE